MTDIIDLRQRTKDRGNEPPKAPEKKVHHWLVLYKPDDSPESKPAHKIVEGILVNLVPVLIIIEDGTDHDPNNSVFVLPSERLISCERVNVEEAPQ